MEKVGIDKARIHDRTFCVSYPLEDASLLASVAKYGILTPLALFSRERPVIVSGFRRAEAALQLGMKELPCVFLDVGEPQALLCAMHDNLARPLNTVEKALCLQKMLHLGFPADEVLGFMATLGLPPREAALRTAIALASTEAPVKSFVAAHGLPLSVVDQLFGFGPDEGRLVIGLLDSLRTTVSELREIMQLMMLVRVKKGAIPFVELRAAKDARDLRQRLKRQTHPLLTGMEERLARIRAGAALPPNIRVKVDPAFERESIDIEIRAGTSREVEEALARLTSLAAGDFFRSIFELTDGTPHHG